MKFCTWIIFKKLSGNRHFHEDRPSVRYILYFKAWRDLSLYFPYLLADLGEIRCMKSPRDTFHICGFCENRCNESKILINSVNEFQFVDYISTLIFRFSEILLCVICTKCCSACQISIKIGPGKFVRVFWVWIKLHLEVYRKTKEFPQG
jgi:hypothetical protein